MFIIAWVLFFALLSYFFNLWLQPKPSSIAYTHSNGVHEVAIMRSRQHHYFVKGTINGIAVLFFIDTGASTVSIPASVAKRLKLRRGYPLRAQTASDVVTVYLTRLKRLTIGPITLHNIKATINPRMSGETILLGMSALKHLDISQRNGQLILKQMKK